MSMAAALVERATHDALIGPDWGMNMEICDILNRDPGQAKDVVKAIKKRLSSKNPKVQLLTLTLLETLIKNSGDIVHVHVAEKDVLHEMVKMAKKKHQDFHVKEKILLLVDLWQEAFGGTHARYPQYYAAYQELLRAGAVFPPRSDRSVPIFTPPQTQPISSYPQPSRDHNYQEVPASSAGSEFPILRLAEIQGARGLMDVLEEMLNAIDPRNREALKQDVIIDLVDQCRTYKQRVVRLVNTVSDEELLFQGLALNDDLERVLAKHDALVAGITIREETPKSTVIKKADTTEPGQSTSTSRPPLQQLLLPAPQTSNNNSTSAPARVDPLIDLLSGDDYLTPESDNSLALVPVNDPFATSASDQNVLALADMFSSNTRNSKNAANGFNSQSSFPHSAAWQTHHQPQQNGQYYGYANGNNSISSFSQYNQGPFNGGANINGQYTQNANLQQLAHNYGSLSDQGSSFPPPPWESQQVHPGNPFDNNTNPLQLNHYGGTQSQFMQNAQMNLQSPNNGGQTQLFYPQGPPQMPILDGGGQFTGYTYTQPVMPVMPVYAYMIPYDLAQKMYTLSIQESRKYTPSQGHLPPSSSLLQPGLPSKPPKMEDKLFGDLVNMAKSKPSTPRQ